MLPELDPVFTLSDLQNWQRPGVSLAVLGHPIKHSISPPMHNAALAALARQDPRFHDWKYFRFDIHPDDLPRALELLHARKFRGVNLTVPHKVIAFDRVSQVDPAARPIGAVNTLLWTKDGWHGFNTDGYGLAAAIGETLGLSLSGTPVILLGAGGAARGAAVECLQRGCSSLWILNRTRDNLDTLFELLKPLAKETPVHRFVLSDAPPPFPARALFIQATTVGLQAAPTVPFQLQQLMSPAGVFEMIYNPPETLLLAKARELGIPHANGLSMLVHQGAKSLEIWSGIPATQTAPTMLAAAQAALRTS
ncbi:MAG: shikimate dehydrogenase [Opitutaceae bacterium]